jgi:hypothetical protein
VGPNADHMRIDALARRTLVRPPILAADRTEDKEERGELVTVPRRKSAGKAGRSHRRSDGLRRSLVIFVPFVPFVPSWHTGATK